MTRFEVRALAFMRRLANLYRDPRITAEAYAQEKTEGEVLCHLVIEAADIVREFETRNKEK